MYQKILKKALLFPAECYLQDRQRLILWWPVAFGLGILAYFSLDRQPVIAPVIVIALSLSLLLFIRRAAYSKIAIIGLLAICCGFLVVHMRTAFLDTMMLEQQIRGFDFIGVVKDINDTQRGVRLTIELQERPEEYKGLQKIRLSLRSRLTVPPIGTKIAGKANLLPFGGVISETGYNFRRVAYFQGIGATGQLLQYQNLGLVHGKLELALKGLRKKITDRIMAQFSVNKDAGGIMAALVTGVRGSISSKTRQNFTDAGLAHLLAISGLHLSLIAGIIFFLMRRVLAISMHLAENYDLKKLAAGLTVPFLLFYLIISGVGIPALRAFLMILLTMLAIIIDRNPLSMRLVCFAASVILLIYPESLLSASFQLSFSAVIALIGVYEGGWRPFKDRIDRSSISQKLTLYIAGIIATTLIASFATTPFTIAIFQRFSLQGVLGNLVAIPMTGFIIMPLIVLFLLLMPFGLEFLVTPFLEHAIQILIKVSGYVASLPGAALTIPEQPPLFLTLFVLGGIWFCLWQQKWRHFGMILMLSSFFCMRLTAGPKIVIPEREQAIYGFDGRRAFCLGCRASGFAQEMFLRQVGHSQMERFSGRSLTMELGGTGVFLVTEKLSKAELRAQCSKVDYLLSPRSIRYACPGKGKIVDRLDVQQQGTVIVSFDHKNVKMTTSCKLQGSRPWSEKRCRHIHVSDQLSPKRKGWQAIRDRLGF